MDFLDSFQRCADSSGLTFSLSVSFPAVDIVKWSSFFKITGCPVAITQPKVITSVDFMLVQYCDTTWCRVQRDDI